MHLALRLTCLAVAAVGVVGCAAPRTAPEDALPGALLYAPDDAKWLPPSTLPDFQLVADASAAADASARAPTDRG